MTRTATLPDEFELAVEQRHIDMGKPNDTRFCAIALSAAERFPGRLVDMARLSLMVDDTFYEDDDDSARIFVYRFDQGYPVHPQQFTFRRKNF